MDLDKMSQQSDDDDQDVTHTLQWAKQIFSIGCGLVLILIGATLLIAASSIAITYQPSGTACPTLPIALLLLFCTVTFASGGAFFGKSLMQMEPKEVKKEYKLGQLYYQFIALILGIKVLMASSIFGIISGTYLYPGSGKCSSTATCCMQSSATTLLAISGTVLTLIFGAFMALVIGFINVIILHYHLSLKSGEHCWSCKNILWPVHVLKNKHRFTSFL
jgi:hypothetical protein